MRRNLLPGPAFALTAWFCGCGTSASTPLPQVVLGAVTAVTPSATGVPNSVTTLAGYEFISLQGTGQIFTYNVSNGVQVLASVYAMPCKDLSGMVVASTGGANVMAVVCYDTGSLVTLALRGTTLYAGCYDEATVQRLDVTNPAAMKLVQSLAGIAFPQRLVFADDALIVPSSMKGGAVYRIGLGPQ